MGLRRMDWTCMGLQRKGVNASGGASAARLGSHRHPLPMKAYKKEFLELALELDVLRFGRFELKSGRVSPYFFNSGHFNTGAAAAKVGRCYAAAIAALDFQFDVLFGPAYKGIPLVALTAAALAEHHELDYPFAYNRKERKDHGEGGQAIGAPLAGRVLIVDDVITAGTAIREAAGMIHGAGASLAGILVALDREEIGVHGDLPTTRQVEAELGVPVRSIASFTDLIEHIEVDPAFASRVRALHQYRERYGAQLPE